MSLINEGAAVAFKRISIIDIFRGDDSLMVMFFGRCWMKELQSLGSAMD